MENQDIIFRVRIEAEVKSSGQEQPGRIGVRGKKSRICGLVVVRSGGRRAEMSSPGETRSMIWWKRRRLQELRT